MKRIDENFELNYGTASIHTIYGDSLLLYSASIIAVKKSNEIIVFPLCTIELIRFLDIYEAFIYLSDWQPRKTRIVIAIGAYIRYYRIIRNDGDPSEIPPSYVVHFGRFLLFSIGNIAEERHPSPERKSIHSIRTRHLFPANGIHPVVVGLLFLPPSLPPSLSLSLLLYFFVFPFCFSFPLVSLFFLSVVTSGGGRGRGMELIAKL